MNLGKLIRHETILAVLVVVALIALAAQSDRFFTVDNLLNQGRLMTEVGLIAIVMTFVIVTGGIDLSVGSILGMSAILLGVFWKNVGLPLELAIVLTLGVGAVAGFANGLIITRFKFPPLIATLGTLALYRGIAEGVSEARSVRGYPDWFYVLGQGQFLGVPTQLWLFLVATVIVFGAPLLWLLLATTKTPAEITGGAPLSFGSFAQLGAAWSHLLDYQDGIILTWLRNSTVYAVASVAIALGTALPAGYALAKYRFPGRRVVLFLTLITMLVPSAALILPLYLEFSTLNLLNTPWAVILPLGFFPFGVYLV